MAITYSSPIITLTNESSATLALITAAVPTAMTQTGSNTYHTTNRIKLVNSTLKLFDEVLYQETTHTANSSTELPLSIDSTSLFQMGEIDVNNVITGASWYFQEITGSGVSGGFVRTISDNVFTPGGFKIYGGGWNLVSIKADDRIVPTCLLGNSSREIIDCNLNGNIGFRLDGTATLVRNVQCNNGANFTVGGDFEVSSIIQNGSVQQSGYDVGLALNSFYGPSLLRNFTNTTYDTTDDDIYALSRTDNITHKVYSPKLLTTNPTIGWDIISNTGNKVEIYSLLQSKITKNGSNYQDVRIYLEDSTSAQSLNVLTDSNGEIGDNDILSMFSNQTVSTSTGNSFTQRTPHTLKLRKYGDVFTERVQDMKSDFLDQTVMSTNPYTVANEATASGYSTKFSIDWTNRIITVTGTTTPQEMYDYTQYAAAQSANMQYDQLMTATQTGKFYMGDTRIVIASGGTLNHDPDLYTFTFEEVPTSSNEPLGTGAVTPPIHIQTGGIYNLGIEYTSGEVTTYSTGVGIKNIKTLGSLNGFNATYRRSGVVYVNGGTFNYYGGVIDSPIPPQFEAGIVNIKSGTLIVDYDSTESYPPGIWLQQAVSSDTIQNLKIVSQNTSRNGVLFLFDRAPQIFESNIFTYGSGVGTGGQTLEISPGIAEPVTIKDYSSLAPSIDVNFWRENYMEMINPETGSDLIYSGMAIAGSDKNIGFAEIYKEVKFEFSDIVMSPIDGAKVFTVDTNNGARHSTYKGYSWTDDRSYTFTTDATGVTETRKILTAAIVKDTDLDPLVGINYDYRSKNNDTTDLFDFMVVSYGYLVANISNLELKGNGALLYSSILFSDNWITETTKTTVAAYTGIVVDSIAKTITVSSNHTINEIYDYIKWYESENPDIVWDNSKASAISTTDGSNYQLASGWKLKLQATISGGTLNGAYIEIDTSGDYTTSLSDCSLDFLNAGTYDYNSKTFIGTTDLYDTPAATVTVKLATGVSYVNHDPTHITVEQGTVTTGIHFTGLVAGTQVYIFQHGTQTVIDSTESSGTEFTWSETYSADQYVDYTIYKADYGFIRATNILCSTSVLQIPISQVFDRSYVTSSGLTFGVNATANTTTKLFGLTANSEVQNWYSFMKESWISESTLKNELFPLTNNGPSSFQLKEWEWDGTTSVNHLSRDGMRYVDASDTITAIWAAILSVGEATGLQVRYQQSDGGTTHDAKSTGPIDQLIQVYGDATHGNFDHTDWLVLKIQADGYDEASADVVNIYGTLADEFYVVGLVPLSNGLTTGDPSVTGVTITDHGASPVNWNGKVFSITITDSATPHTGTEIMRWLRYNFDLGGTFQSKDAFDWHDLTRVHGSKFKTINDVIYGDVGSTLKGVRVVKNDGTSAHPDFDLFTADDGTTYIPPIAITIKNTNIIDNSRAQLYNVTKDTELDNSVVSGGLGYSYSTTYGASEPVSAGDTIRLRATYHSGTTYKENYEENVIAAASGITFAGTQKDWTDANNLNIDGSTITEYATDYPNIQIDIQALDNKFKVTELVAWTLYQQTTADGIRHYYGCFESTDSANWKIITSLVDIYLDNTRTDTATQEDDAILMRDDSVYPQVVPTSGGGGIGMIQSGLVFTVVSGSGVTAQDKTDIINGVWSYER